MSSKVVIIDYQMGNIHSVERKISRLGSLPVISSDPEVIASADKLILPGIGHFQKAMQNLSAGNLIDVLNEQVLVKKKPILGICLGMQIMALRSEEGSAEGLGWIDAEVKKFRIKDTLKFKVPHTGWNQIIVKKDSVLNRNIPDRSEFYFVHSYHMICNQQEDILHETFYEYNFTSAVEKNNIFGVQYHPEKSLDAGETLLKNFIQL